MYVVQSAHSYMASKCDKSIVWESKQIKFCLPSVLHVVDDFVYNMKGGNYIKSVYKLSGKLSFIMEKIVTEIFFISSFFHNVQIKLIQIKFLLYTDLGIMCDIFLPAVLCSYELRWIIWCSYSVEAHTQIIMKLALLTCHATLNVCMHWYRMNFLGVCVYCLR